MRVPATPLRLLQRRCNSTTTPASIYARRLDVLLSTPTWSVKTLLPPSNTSTPSTTADREISPTTLHHLLRLSALPPPDTPEQEEKLLDALEAHLHFVRAIQKVDTTGVAPLARIEEEVEGLRRGVAFEEMVGGGEVVGGLEWKPTKMAKKEAGGFYVLDEIDEGSK